MKSIYNILNQFARTKLVQGFTRHAGKIAGGAFLTSNFVMLGKDYLAGKDPNVYEQMTGVFFIASSAVLTLADRYPKVKLIVGMLSFCAAMAFARAGWGLPGQNAQLFTSSVIAIQSLLMIFEESLQRQAEVKRKTLVSRIFALFERYPLLTSTVLGAVLSTIPMVFVALERRDMGLLAICGLWFVGDTGILASDNNIKKLILEDIGGERQAVNIAVPKPQLP